MNFARRSVGVLAATGLIAAALTGCSSDSGKSESKTDSASNSARGNITFAMGKNDTDKVKPIIEKWNAAHPNEKVELKELAGEADAQRDTLVQSLQAKKSDYDVMALDVIWTADFAAHQWLAPLEGDLKVDTSKLLKSTVESATYNGKLYAVPQNTNGQLLYRNTELATQAPQKFDDIKASCAQLSGQDCLTLQLKQYEGLTVNTVGFMEGWGGKVVDTDGKTPKVDSEQSKAGLQALVDAYKDGTIAKSSISATEEETNLAFTEGKTAYAINWPYMYSNAEKGALKGKFEVQPLVGKDGVGVSTLGGYNNGININSKHKATARDFIEFIISEENQKSFADNSFPPVLASIYDDQQLVEKYPYLPALKKSLEAASPRPVSPFYPAISKAVQDNSYAALTAGKSVDDATRDMKAAIQNAAK
ncbi:ABC transporter substrate-binding protein [Corynebacterium epidermidicanis]|uniref:ABC-type sugar transport system, periplasmic component n=1 Tax=Corynebacterium epidermidicanis TaxID=1050174 RepID=A0A0G3GSI5_9CORY|nr:ABC transporter substrate-binding protein [Corynebacterium epidermidicanis]AKK02518.1 ABC-type sugar transport system, periplasmic component [Corynebacterium epidermidicanis]